MGEKLTEDSVSHVELLLGEHCEGNIHVIFFREVAAGCESYSPGVLAGVAVNTCGHKRKGYGAAVLFRSSGKRAVIGAVEQLFLVLVAAPDRTYGVDDVLCVQ